MPNLMHPYGDPLHEQELIDEGRRMFCPPNRNYRRFWDDVPDEDLLEDEFDEGDDR